MYHFLKAGIKEGTKSVIEMLHFKDIPLHYGFDIRNYYSILQRAVYTQNVVFAQFLRRRPVQ